MVSRVMYAPMVSAIQLSATTPVIHHDPSTVLSSASTTIHNR